MSATVDALQQALDRARTGTSFEPITLPRESEKQMAARLDAARQKTDVPFLEAGEAALEVESHTRGLTRSFVEQQQFPFDSNDVPPSPGTPEFKTLTDGVPEEYWPNLGRGRSAAHREFIKQNIFEEMDATRKLEEAGWVGTTLRIGTAVLDPVSLLAIAGTAGSSLMISSSRAVRAAKLAAAAGVENVALEATLFGTRETKDVDDLYVALVGGLVAGGAIGAILPKAVRKELYETGSEIMDGGTGPGRAIGGIDAELDRVSVFHGTKAPADVVRGPAEVTGSADIGPHFSVSRETAELFAADGGTAGRVIAAKLNPGRTLEMPDLAGWHPLQVAEWLDDAGLTRAKGTVDSLGELGAKVLRATGAEGDAAGARLVTTWLQEKGYDTIKYVNKFEGKPVDTYIVLNPAKTFGEDAGRSVGAAEATRAPTDLLKEQPSPEILNTPQLKGAEAKLRYGLFAQAAKSDIPHVRYLGNKLFEDGVGQRGRAQGVTVEIDRQLTNRRALTTFYRDANPGLAEYLQGVPIGQRGDATNRFFEGVTEALRAQNFEGPIGRAAKAMQESTRTVAEQGKRFGVKGLEDIDLDSGYVTRIWSAEKLDTLISRQGFGNAQIEKLVATAFARSADVADDVAAKVAKGLVHNVRMRGAGVESDFRITMANKDELAAMMRDSGVSEKDIAKVTDALKLVGEKDTSKAGKIARAKRRLDLDESTVLPLKNSSGETVLVKITDLFENDARILTRMYAASVGGHAAFARAGILSSADWTKAIDNARLYARDRLGMSKEAIDKELSNLEMARKIMTGQPVIDYTHPARALSFLGREWAYIAQSGMFGLAQASELMTGLVTGGLRLTTEAVPAMKGMFTRGRDGLLEDALARDMEDIWAPGTDLLIHSTVSRFESGYDEMLRPVAGSMLDKTEGVRHGLRKAAGYASGLAPVTTFMQRLFTRFVAQRLVNTAFKRGRQWSGMRLEALGLDKPMQDRVFGQIRKHVVMDGATPRLDLKTWTDLDARDAFIIGVERETQRNVLTPSLGASLPRQLDSETMRVFTQFMTFAVQAHERLLLHGVKHMDAERAVAWLTGTALAGAAYVGRMHLEAAGRSDRKKFLRERLAPDQIAKAAFNMSGFSALIPMGIDTALTIAPGVDPIFSHGRTSGLGTSLLDFGSYPAGAVGKGALNMVTSMEDGRLTKSEYNSITRTFVPLARAIGVKQALNILGRDLPEK